MKYISALCPWKESYKLRRIFFGLKQYFFHNLDSGNTWGYCGEQCWEEWNMYQHQQSLSFFTTCLRLSELIRSPLNLQFFNWHNPAINHNANSKILPKYKFATRWGRWMHAVSIITKFLPALDWKRHSLSLLFFKSTVLLPCFVFTNFAWASNCKSHLPIDHF